MSINMVALMGRLTFNPELKSTTTGTSVTRFQIAVDRNYTPKGQEKQTDFIDCVAWKQTAEFIHRYFTRGSMIAIEGSIQTSTFSLDDGSNRKRVEVVANNVSFCGDKKQSEEPNVSVTKERSKYNIEELDDDEDIFGGR